MHKQIKTVWKNVIWRKPRDEKFADEKMVAKNSPDENQSWHALLCWLWKPSGSSEEEYPVDHGWKVCFIVLFMVLLMKLHWAWIASLIEEWGSYLGVKERCKGTKDGS